jgi:hypothetical protein
MTMEQLLVTVDFDRVGPETRVDLLQLVAKVPTARVISGNPAVSVKVSVDQSQRGKLIAAVSGYCVVDNYADLDLY